MCRYLDIVDISTQVRWWDTRRMDSAVSFTQLAGLAPDPSRVFGSSVLEWVAT